MELPPTIIIIIINTTNIFDLVEYESLRNKL